MKANDLVVRTHVGRDLRQTAQLFRTLEAAVWEYVANSLEYVDPGVTPEVRVELDHRARRIVIADNGRGMNLAGLQQFFTLHGENQDRRAGRRGRGKFGTGKSAAFGVAKRLRVTTVRGGKRNEVELTLDDIEASDGLAIPVRWLIQDETTTSPNGTVVTIEDVLLSRMPPEPVVRYVERNLAYWRAVQPVVFIGSHRCSPWQPTVVKTVTVGPTDEQRAVIGDAQLTINVAQAPLEEGQYGIGVTAGSGNLVAIETAGIESKEFGNYLFGEVDVAELDEPSELAAYDLSRSLKLNPANPVAAVLIGFIGFQLDDVRRQLVEERRQRRSELEFKRLEAEAAKIAELLNSDLSEVVSRLANLDAMRKRQGAVARAGSTGGGEGTEVWVEGDDEPGLLDERRHAPETIAEPHGREAPKLARRGEPSPDGPDRVSPRGGNDAKPAPKGGLDVRFENLGPDEDRSVYDAPSRIILINLDHPTVAAALAASGIDDVTFRRLSYEIAFTQYALAISQEVLKRDPDLTADDILFEVRDALRRITRKAAHLYQVAA